MTLVNYNSLFIGRVFCLFTICFPFLQIFIFVFCGFMNEESPTKMKVLAKQIFPSLFRKYVDLSEDTIVKCLMDCKFNEGIAVNTLERMVGTFNCLLSCRGRKSQENNLPIRR